MYKNILQEFCQKEKIDLPVYETSIFEDGFVSTAYVKLEDQILFAGGKFKNKKKQSELSAAKHLLGKLNTYLEDNKVDIFPNKPTRILVDLENIPINDLFSKYNFENVIFEIFATENSSCLTKLDKKSDILMNIHTVKSSRRDAADILMTLYVRQLFYNQENLIIITKDHFGDSLMDCLDEFVNCFLSYKCVSSVEELIKQFHEIV